MAQIEIILANLPALIAERSDSLKRETAIRYVGDIIFDASQNRDGDKARGLARVLSGSASPEEARSRDVIMNLFRDGYLDRYSDFIVFRDIAMAAGMNEGLGAKSEKKGGGEARGEARGKVQGKRFYGRWPGLHSEKLDEGVDLAVATDYRQVLSEILAARSGGAALGAVFPDFKSPGNLGILRT